MSSIRHNPPEGTQSGSLAEDLYLDAAREAILAVGWSRTTLTDIARRAGVSRMTIYRRWPDMGALMADLMTREWAGLVQVDARGDHRERIVASVVATVRAVRDNELFRRILELDPEILLPYLLERSGRSQELVVGLLAAEIRSGQRAGQVRLGSAPTLARTLVLTAHGFALSAHTMGRVETFDVELRRLLEGYLSP